MSRDIFVQDLPAGITSTADIPDDFVPAPLGLPRDALIARLLALAPDADFSDPAWGVLDRESFSVEFNLGEGDVVDHFAMHVRGDGDAFIADVLSALGLQALDPQAEGGVLRPPTPS